MASHGVPRPSANPQRTEEARVKEVQQIASYRSLVDQIHAQVNKRDFSPELLEKTGELLQKNPEYYTIWNIRRRIYCNEFKIISQAAKHGEIPAQSQSSQILDIIHLDLGFLFPLLLNFPKCYWIWNHRIWLLGQSSTLLPVQQARKIWEDELVLVGKMLTRDSRNYHGWGYRRFIIKNLESPTLQGESMARKEYAYTTKMIGNNLSNFSAWHARLNCIERILNEEDADSTGRQEMLESELDYIHKALFDPFDQSLWFYHQALMSTFDPAVSSNSIAPDLSTDEKLKYITREQDFIKELLEDVEDCKWAYQALIDCSFIEARLRGQESPSSQSAVREWLQTLQKLDPLRAGRWSDMEASLK